ncbi:STAS domain-containing protein [Streptomyces sp. NPDC060048]|uniref:STAS domain-containing protein n=1 Tax=unclassified Streptomyces TaxID=2593676 RepID=UPI00367BCA9B
MTGPVFQAGTALDANEAGLRLVGALDLDGAAQLRAAIADCFARRPDRLVLDLRGLRFCDCAGLNVLVEAKATAARIGTELRVEGARPQVARLFALAGVDEFFAGAVPRLPPRTL